MNLSTEPVTARPRNAAEPLLAKDWLDSFATGACDQESFIQAVGGIIQRTPDAGWELLALVDQYYRRGKIDAAAFTTLKTHLQNVLLGQTGTGDLSLPLRHPRDDLNEGPPAADAATAVQPAEQPTPPAERTLAVGDVLRGRYRVVAMLGRGGMGAVFEAIDQYRLDDSNGDQKVAIKVLHTAVIQRPRLFAELRREFQHLQSLTHPNIVRVHEFDRDGDLAFFTMEYLSGVLLTRVIATHAGSSLHRPYAFSILRDVGAAVVHAHARGVVHGDLNPGNIFITDTGDVRVLDFGAAHPLRRAPWISDFEVSQQITVATPRFASCQLLEGETADARDDLFALACIAYVLLTGNHPYRDQAALRARTLRLKPARPEGLNRRQWNALRSGLEFERDRRPVDVAAWLRELGSDTAVPHLPALPSLLTIRPSRRADKRWIMAAAVLAAIGCGIWWMVSHQNRWREAQTTAVASLKNRLADTVLGQLWETDAAATAAAQAPAPDATPAGAPEHSGIAPAAPPPRRGDAHALAPVSRPVAAAPRQAAAPVAPYAVVPAEHSILARIELAADTVEVDPGEQVAHVIVHRTRTLRGDASFTWWTESGTAKPGRDFTPVKPQVEHIEDGKHAVDLTIPIVMDASRHEPRSFYIVIDEPSENAMLGARTLTMVTVPGTE